jgi:uncharacterized protein (DUF488 family)
VPASETALAVYTVGYQGRSVDAFFDYLLRRGIRRVIDVRSNPVSRKYGFAKKTLSETARKLDVAYVHIPRLGIPPDERKDLQSMRSYQQLFARFERHTLPSRTAELRDVAAMVSETPTTLMCAERDADRCHRSQVAIAVSSIAGLSVKNL